MKRKSVYIAIIVFFVTFIVFRAIFSNWDYLKNLLLGTN